MWVVQVKKKLNTRTLTKKPWHELTKAEKDYLWKKQVLRCDNIFSKFIRTRDHVCITCGKTTDLQCSHHYTKRSHLSVRWDERNAYAQCSVCHTRHHHVDAGEYTLFLLDTLGREEFDLLRLKAHAMANYTYQDLLEVELYYAARLGGIV